MRVDGFQFQSGYFVKLTAVIFLSLSSVVFAGNLEELGISNLKQPEASVYVSGQPDETAFKTLAESGVQIVVNLRPESEQRFNEKNAVEAAGMRYIHIPVSGASGVTQENANKLKEALAVADGKTVLVHCASGNRVGALRALIEAQTQAGNIDNAIEKGKSWGLTGLETMVRDVLAP